MQNIVFNFCFYVGVIAVLFSGFGVITATSPQERKSYLSLATTAIVLGVIALLAIYYLAPYMNL